MATLWRAASRGRFALLTYARQRVLASQASMISTSKEKKDGLAINVEAIKEQQKSDIEKQLEKQFGNADPKAEKNWISYGYSLTDQNEDRYAHNLVMFFFMTVFSCVGGFMIYYMPERRLSEWSIREAYLQIEQRERAGLPHVSPNMVPVEMLELPSDEELQGMEIII